MAGTQNTLPFDITQNRHGGNARSAAANVRLHGYKPTLRERIRLFIAACEYHGATVKEIAANMQHATQHRAFYPNEISGRATELKAEGTIFDSGRERDGSAVLVARRDWRNGSGR